MISINKKQIIKKINDGFVNIEKWMKLFKIQKRDYQIKAMKWCIAKENGYHITFDKNGDITGPIIETKKAGLVADEMGLGKTIVMLGTWVGNFKRNTLIVLPSALLHQWSKLIKKFFGFEPLVFHGHKSRMSIDKIKQYHIVLTTYGMVSTRPKNKRRNDKWTSPLWEIQWDRIIFDEAHHLRNHFSNKHKGVAKLTGDVKWFITGTPIQNSGKDLISLCKLMGFYDEMLENPKNIIEILRKYTLMRSKKQVGLKMEPVENITIHIDVYDSPEEAKLVKDVHSMLSFTNVTVENVDAAISYLKGDSPLPLLVRSRQACVAPTILTRRLKTLIAMGEIPSDIRWQPCKTNTKLRVITETAMEADGRILMFCHYMQEMDLLEKMLTEKGLSVKVMNGNTSMKERKYIGLPFIKNDDWTKIFAKSKFEKETNLLQSLIMPMLEPDVLLVQIQSCCEGLNLQQFNNVFFTSPHWNPAVEDQAVCRAHRIGQKKKVKVYKFITEIQNSDDDINLITLDKHCNNVQEKKREAIEQFARDASIENNVPE
jgi:SNF2 family DNA or RNA helicase